MGCIRVIVKPFALKRSYRGTKTGYRGRYIVKQRLPGLFHRRARSMLHGIVWFSNHVWWVKVTVTAQGHCGLWPIGWAATVIRSRSQNNAAVEAGAMVAMRNKQRAAVSGQTAFIPTCEFHKRGCFPVNLDLDWAGRRVEFHSSKFRPSSPAGWPLPVRLDCPWPDNRAHPPPRRVGHSCALDGQRA